MKLLSAVSPEFAENIRAVLSDRGEHELASRVSSLRIYRWSYDHRSASGYVCFVPSRPISNLVRPVSPIGRSVLLLAEHGFNIDIGYDGRILGAEFIANEQLVENLGKS